MDYQTNTTQQIACWQHFKCKNKECEAYHKEDSVCWLTDCTYCHEFDEGTWIEKIEACLKCEVFASNFSKDYCDQTFGKISEQFLKYKNEMEEKQAVLQESQKKLEEFKRTSIYLLRELDVKSQELSRQKDNLEKQFHKKSDELQRAQSRLIQSTKMAAIGRFSAGIAHEINNPLGAIINFARTLLANPEIKGENKGYLELILKGLFRIEKVVRQILSYSNQPKSNPILTDVNQMINESIQFVDYKINEKEIRLKLKLDETLPKALLEPTQIQQVFNNILNNAIDALPQKGKLHIQSSEKDGLLRIEFIDNGHGIEKSELEHVFDPFYSTKDVGKGTGLGLFICYNILQIYNGSMDITSKPGKGTRVVVQLPIPESE